MKGGGVHILKCVIVYNYYVTPRNRKKTKWSAKNCSCNITLLALLLVTNRDDNLGGGGLKEVPLP